MGRSGLRRNSAVVALSLLACDCAIGVREPQLREPTLPLTAADPELKLHLKSGELVVLRNWKVAAAGDRLTGDGQAYTVTREKKGAPQRQDVALADVALVESDTPGTVTSAGLGVLIATTTVLGGITGYCAINPKGCFGSCPTFYVLSPEGREPERPQAEGFSESIARVLEARDLDALEVARPGGSEVAVVMRNEALETHAVRSVRLLAAPQPPGGRVLAGADDRLYPTRALVPALGCRAPEGDCREALAATDGTARVSPADGADLAAHEVVELSFPSARGPRGVVIAARQTLLSTFLFYQTMAFTGRAAGEFLAALERGGPVAGRRALGMARVLGGIDVEVAEGDSDWRPVGSFDEAGPIAGDRRVLPFEASGSGTVRVRLRLARGHWRLDSVAVADLGDPVVPTRLKPLSVDRDGHRDDRALTSLREGDRHVVTHPGDAYRLRFRLPASDSPLELFLESEGFYYEWMRGEWLAEEDGAMAALALADPAEALRRLAPAYKTQEGRLEQAFWASRFRK
jgi:hypothetical protein